ncbi:MAG: cysteine hydrolase [Clostridiales bacterium]|nr:cysteine hydrolase [Clostridiales bacterium]
MAAKLSKSSKAPSTHLLLVVDMQNDFITGSLGTKEAQAIVQKVVQKVKNHQGPVLFTRDTHDEGYMSSQEGALLPVSHCQRDTEGWEIQKDLEALRILPALDKPSFGSLELAEEIQRINAKTPLASITFVGLCTDICVISNAIILKAALPEVKVIVDAACCAGVTPQSHQTALDAMKACQIFIENEA